MSKQIIQIIPAQSGWWITSVSHRGALDYREYRPIACWALVEYDDGDRVVQPLEGIDCSGSMDWQDFDVSADVTYQPSRRWNDEDELLPPHKTERPA